MKKFLKQLVKTVLKIVGILFILLLCFIVFTEAVFFFTFKRVKVIHMADLGEIDYRLDIPVRYVNRQLSNSAGFSMHSTENWRYSIRRAPDDKLWINICRYGHTGFEVYTAKYEITDPAVEKKLIELWPEAEKLRPEAENPDGYK